MAHELRLPELGAGLTEGEVTRWLVAEGDEVVAGAPLLELQTDKATVEVPSEVGGLLLAIVAPVGTVAPVGSVLAIVGEPGESILHVVEAPKPEPASRLVAVVPDEPEEAVRATSGARDLARELGVALRSVSGSGLEGRILEEDVRAAGDRPRGGEGRRVPIRGIRRAIVEQVERTHREIPAVTFVEECDFTGLDVANVLPLALLATARALRAHPWLNARIEGDEIVLLERIDIGIVVSTEDGLLVPVVRRCHERSLQELEDELRRLVEGARTRRLAAEELRGSTFTITSAGRLGGILVTPLINHPEVAILGLHRIADRAVVVDGEIVVRPVGNVSVTFDHRVVDGAAAAAFCLDVIRELRGLSPGV